MVSRKTATSFFSLFLNCVFQLQLTFSIGVRETWIDVLTSAFEDLALFTFIYMPLHLEPFGAKSR